MANFSRMMSNPGFSPFMLNTGMGLLAASQGGLTPAQRSSMMMQAIQSGTQAGRAAQLMDFQRQQMEDQRRQEEQRMLGSRRLVNSMIAPQGPRVASQMNPGLNSRMLALGEYAKATGDIGPFVEATKPGKPSPTKTAGGFFQDASGNWQPIPGYQEAALERAAAGKSDVNVNIGASPIGKLLKDDEVLAAQGVPESDPAREAIKRQIAQQGTPSGEKARFQEMIMTGKQAMDEIEQDLFPEGLAGPINEDLIALGTGPGVPFTEGRTYASRIDEVAGLILRLETGAAQTESEVKNTAKRYKPSVLDNERTKRDKISRLRRRFENALKIQEGEGTVAQPTGLPASGFEGMTDDEVLKAIGIR